MDTRCNVVMGVMIPEKLNLNCPIKKSFICVDNSQTGITYSKHTHDLKVK